MKHVSKRIDCSQILHPLLAYIIHCLCKINTKTVHIKYRLRWLKDGPVKRAFCLSAKIHQPVQKLVGRNTQEFLIKIPASYHEITKNGASHRLFVNIFSELD